MRQKILCWLGFHERHEDYHLPYTATWIVHLTCPRCGRHYTDCAPTEID